MNVQRKLSYMRYFHSISQLHMDVIEMLSCFRKQGHLVAKLNPLEGEWPCSELALSK